MPFPIIDTFKKSSFVRANFYGWLVFSVVATIDVHYANNRETPLIDGFFFFGVILTQAFYWGYFICYPLVEKKRFLLLVPAVLISFTIHCALDYFNDFILLPAVKPDVEKLTFDLKEFIMLHLWFFPEYTLIGIGFRHGRELFVKQ